MERLQENVSKQKGLSHVVYPNMSTYNGLLYYPDALGTAVNESREMGCQRDQIPAQQLR